MQDFSFISLDHADHFRLEAFCVQKSTIVILNYQYTPFQVQLVYHNLNYLPFDDAKRRLDPIFVDGLKAMPTR